MTVYQATWMKQGNYTRSLASTIMLNVSWKHLNIISNNPMYINMGRSIQTIPHNYQECEEDETNRKSSPITDLGPSRMSVRFRHRKLPWKQRKHRCKNTWNCWKWVFFISSAPLQNMKSCLAMFSNSDKMFMHTFGYKKSYYFSDKQMPDWVYFLRAWTPLFVSNLTWLENLQALDQEDRSWP